MRVIQLQAQNWEKLSSNTIPLVTSVQSTAAYVSSETVTSKLNTAAPPFIPSAEIEFHYQQPVRNAGTCIYLLKSYKSVMTMCVSFIIYRGVEGLL